jgi:vancomycin permeability regulator SanA
MNAMFLQRYVAMESRRESFLLATARALALSFGCFSLINLFGNVRSPGFDASLWWIDLRVFPEIAGKVFLLAASVCFIAFALRPASSPWRRFLTGGTAGALAMVSVWNILEFYSLLWQGRVRTPLPLPFSLLVLAALALIFFVNLRRPSSIIPARLSRGVVAAFVVCAIAFPIAQMFCFGKTDYRRAADVAVVFGARTYKDGRPSDALADRVKTACGLYRDGLVKKLIFSGGPGDGSVPETETMRRLAIGLGVKPGDILTDPAGLNTEATVENTRAMFAKLGARQILVVSHFYHLPRIKLAYQRAGWDVCTVPAKENRFIWKTPYFIAREVAADWSYYFRPLAAGLSRHRHAGRALRCPPGHGAQGIARCLRPRDNTCFA